MRNLFTTETQRAQRNELTLTAETQRRRGINVGAGLAPAPDWATARVAPTKVNLRWAQTTLRYLLIMTSILTLLMVAACGGGGGGSSSTSPSSTIIFTGSTPGSNSVYTAQNNITGDDLTIDIKANSTSSGVYGTAFNVDFDSSKITYESYENGSFLEEGGNSASYQVALQSNNSGRLVVGIARQGDVSGVTGSGTLITLKFKVEGSSSLSFSDNELRNSSNQAISGTSWYGGTVTVQ